MNRIQYILKKNIPFIAIIIITGIIASLMEGLTWGFVIPLLEGVRGETTGGVPFPLNQISYIFVDMELKQRILLTAGFIVLFTALKGTFAFTSNIFTLKLQMRVVKHYRMLCFDQLIKVGMQYIHSQKNAHLQTIAIIHTRETARLVKEIGLLTPKVFTISVLLCLLTLISWKLTLVSLILVSFASLVLHKVVKNAGKRGKTLAEKEKSINSTVLDFLIGMKVIRIFSQQERMRNIFEHEVDHHSKNAYRLVKTESSVQPFFETTGVLCLAVLLIAGSFIIIRNEAAGMEIVLTFIFIFFRILPPFQTINRARVSIAGYLPFYRELYRFLETHDKPYIKGGHRTFGSFNKAIEFRNVNFSYNTKDSFVLRDISFQIPKNKKVAIIGPSGSGKSTITELLLSFYYPKDGSITIDGIDLKEFDLMHWRRKIGVVSQDIFLFNDTISHNIKFSKPEAAEKEVEWAARLAHAHEFIMKLNDGYNTLIGDRGVLLSGGQRQRIAIARSILTKPELFIFDEATSALDSDSEKIVHQALHEISQGRTVLTIAHRLSTISDSDIVIVMNKGRIIEQGDPKKLLEKEDSVYRRLVKTQNLDIVVI